MPKEKIHIPGVSTTPEQILAERETEEETAPLKTEQIKEQVSELFELSAARAEAGKHAREAWGGLTKKEREGLKAKGEEEVLARLEAARLDPELAEFCETALEEYDNRIAELSSNPKVLNEYKSQFGRLKETLANVLSYEHLSKEKEAVSKAEEKLRKLYESIGKTPGPIERKKLKDFEIRKNEIEKSLNKFELSPEMVDMLQAREIRRIQKDLERYSFAETESRTDLIREVLPDLLQGAPVLFQGETGSGKSQLAKYISEKYLKKNPAVISISEQIKESQIIGSRGLEAGQTVFNYSEFVKAQKEGRPAILDEINLMPHEFAGILHDLLQKRVGNVWIHPVTGEEIIIRSPIMATANLKSERYKQRYELDVATLRRFIGGAGAREIHYHDIGKKDAEGNLIAPETLKILSAVLANRHGEIQWDKKDALQKAEELRRFIQACRKIQEDFTLSMREDAEESLSRGNRLAFRELVITLKDQIEIMKAWKASGFRESLDSIVLKEFFHKAEISGRAAKDRENMVKVFIANKLFQDTKPEEFKIQGLSPNAIRQWQGQEEAERITSETNEKLNRRAKEFNLKQTFSIETPQIPEYLTKEHIESLNEIFGQNNLEFLPVPSPEILNENYIKMMYPEKQTEKDKKRNLISYRSGWLDQASNKSITKSDETWGEVYIRSMKEELKILKDSVIFIESIQKPDYKDGKQSYGSKDGLDPIKDPLLPIFQETFGKDQNRFNRTHDDLTQKLLPELKEKIIKNLKSKNLNINPENIDIIFCPASLFNLQTILNHPENSQTNTREWTSTPLQDKNNKDTGRRLGVGDSGVGGAAHAVSNLRGSSWGSGGCRLAVVFSAKGGKNI